MGAAAAFEYGRQQALKNPTWGVPNLGQCSAGWPGMGLNSDRAIQAQQQCFAGWSAGHTQALTKG
jgi:hypothetical protein